MTRQQAVRRLFVLWTIIGALPVSILVVQSVAGRYGEDAASAWSWLLMQISPVLSLLLAAIFANPSSAWKKAEIDRFKWRCAEWASLAQGGCILTVLLLEPVLSVNSYELFDRTGIGLSLLQGIVVAAAGAVIFDGR